MKQKYFNRKIFLTLAIIGIILSMLFITNKSDVENSPKDAAVKRPSITVEFVKPVSTTWPQSLAFHGALVAWQEAAISAEVGGLRITALHVDIGTRVKRGQLLAELNSNTIKADIRKAEATVASAKARLREAQANVRRSILVKESGALSEQQIEQYEIEAQTAMANLASAEATLATARIQLTQTQITAVDNGVISSRSGVLGAVVSSGTELFRLVREERVEWRAEVSSDQLTKLKPGQQATITFANGKDIVGKVRQLSPTLDTNTRTGIAYVDLPIQDNVRAGMYVSGRILLGDQPAVVLPSAAITLRDGRHYVFEIDKQHNIVIQREVHTGRTQGNLVEIISGIKPEVSVVKSGGAFLNDGDAIRLVGTGSAA